MGIMPMRFLPMRFLKVFTAWKAVPRCFEEQA
jgi:hypothetical protein